jgi:hypothetical protein
MRICKRHFLRSGWFAVLCVAVTAQTRVDVGGQGKNYDFSNATMTRPFKTGTVLPAQCLVGESYFLSNATAGQNLYGCVAANTWMVLSGGAGSSLPAMTGQSGKVLSNDGNSAAWSSLGGDVGGAVSATVVGRLQGRNVSASAPASGQALVWNSGASQWEPGTVSGSGGALPTYAPSRTSGTVLALPSIAGSTFRFGGAVCVNTIGAGNVTVSSGTGTLWVALGPDCSIRVRHNVVASCDAGCTAISGASGFDPAEQPLHEWTVTSGALAASGISRLTPYAMLPLVAGANVTLAVSGGVTTISATGGGGGGGSSYPPTPLTAAYQYEEFLAGGDCYINVTNLGKLGWRVGSSNGGDTVNCAAGVAVDRPGVVTIGTGATANNEVALWQPVGAFHPGAMFSARFLFKLSSTTSAQALVGVVNGVWQASGGTAHGLYLEKESADTNWFATAESSGTRTRVNTGVAAGTGWVAAQIRRIDATSIGFKIAGTVAELGTAAETVVSANIPAVGLIPSFQMRNTAAGAREMDVDFYDIHITGVSR